MPAAIRKGILTRPAMAVGGVTSFGLPITRTAATGKLTCSVGCPTCTKNAGCGALDYLFLPVHIVTSLLLFAVGYYFGGLYLGTSLVVWGMFVRLVTVLHATWLVNSLSHMWGYKNYETTDDSRNNWLVAIVAYGEGWHNNHHAYPRMAKHGHKWWEFDITWQAIRLLRATGWYGTSSTTERQRKKRHLKSRPRQPGGSISAGNF